MTEKEYKVVISHKAREILGIHIRFLAQVNKESAVEKKKEILLALRSLSQMPQRFPFFEEAYITSNKYHKMYIPKWFIALDQIQDDTVYVDYLLDCRQDYSWLLRK